MQLLVLCQIAVQLDLQRRVRKDTGAKSPGVARIFFRVFGGVEGVKTQAFFFIKRFLGGVAGTGPAIPGLRWHGGGKSRHSRCPMTLPCDRVARRVLGAANKFYRCTARGRGTCYGQEQGFFRELEIWRSAKQRL